jgi:hypothetical protein
MQPSELGFLQNRRVATPLVESFRFFAGNLKFALILL